MPWLSAQTSLHQQNNPPALCRVMKNDILPQYLCQVFFVVVVVCLFILWGLYLPVNWPWKRYAEFRTQNPSCSYKDSRQNSTVVLHSLLSSHEICCQEKNFRLDKTLRSNYRFYQRIYSPYANTIAREKIISVAPTLNGIGLVETDPWPEKFTART